MAPGDATFHSTILATLAKGEPAILSNEGLRAMEIHAITHIEHWFVTVGKKPHGHVGDVSAIQFGSRKRLAELSIGNGAKLQRIAIPPPERIDNWDRYG